MWLLKFGKDYIRSFLSYIVNVYGCCSANNCWCDILYLLTEAKNWKLSYVLLKYGAFVSQLFDFYINLVGPGLRSDEERLSQEKGGKWTLSDIKNLGGKEGSHGLPCL